MTRLRFFLGLIGVPMAAQRQVTGGVNSPNVIAQGNVVISQGGVPKPKNGECPHCSTSAYSGAPSEVRSLSGVWEIREFKKERKAMVECSYCRTVFAVTVTNWRG